MTEQTQGNIKDFFHKVYGWMFAGLALSGFTAYFVGTNHLLQQVILANPFVMFGLIILELILVLIMAFLIKKMPPTMALVCFLLFALVNGATLSVIFLTYDIKSIALAFLLAAGMFGIMSIYGMVTNADLSAMGTIMFMGLIGIIIAAIVNFFLKSAMIDFVISIITVIVFTGLTAYDTQKLKKMSATEGEHASEYSNIAITGALALYLDFINLFLALLRIFGKRK